MNQPTHDATLEITKAFADGLSPVCLDPEGVENIELVLDSFRTAHPDYLFNAKTVFGVLCVAFSRKRPTDNPLFFQLRGAILRGENILHTLDASKRDCNEAVREFKAINRRYRFVVVHTESLINIEGPGCTALH